MKQFLFIVMFGIMPFLMVAQSEDQLHGKRFIEVTGTGETEITPDQIFITITLQERPENREKLTIGKQEENLKSGLKELGIDLSNLTVQSADADYGNYRTFKKDVVISKTYVLKINSAEKLSQVYEKLDKMNAFDAKVSGVDHSKMIDYTRENRIKAIRAAKEKADYLLNAVGQAAGLPLQVYERENYIENPIPMRGARMLKNSMSMAGDNGSGEELSFSKIKIRSSYMVRYEIVNK